MNFNSPLDYECAYKGTLLRNVPAKVLVGIYNQGNSTLSKELGKWLDDNIDDLETAAGQGETATLDTEFELN